jgi:hypothetical protein
LVSLAAAAASMRTFFFFFFRFKLAPSTPLFLLTPSSFHSYPVSLFADFTAHVLRRHNGTSLVGVLKSLPSWSEFTPLGAYLMATRPVGGAGGWYVKPQKHPHVEQAWSWGGFNATAVARWENLLREGGRAGGEWC